MSEFLATEKKTHSCGALRRTDIGIRAVLTGWVDTYRDHGGCVFIDLRDREGLTQVVFDPAVNAEAHALAGDLRNEFCIGVAGEVTSRGENVNPKLPTGEIELRAAKLEIFSRSDTPPFPIADKVETNEALRLKYRYLDLRRPAFQHNLRLRSHATSAARNYLVDHGFLEVETPSLVKYTPGGARNFLVPARLTPGSFYALAESPQIYKQLLMVAGIERYFQFVRCFRDEALRGDRQPEFSQIDIEMSFISEEDLFTTVEGLVARIWREVLGAELAAPFRRMSHATAMEKYGTDKPDLRLDLTLTEVTPACRGCGFRIFEDAIDQGGIVKCLAVPDGDRLSRSQLDGLTPFAKQFGVKGVAFARVEEGGAWRAPFAKVFAAAARNRVNAATGAGPGDVLLFVADKEKAANTCMAAIRLYVGERLGLTQTGQWQFMWLTDPPLFEYSEEEGRLVAAHHPFTAPRAGDEDYLETDPGRVRSRGYDLVLNGVELAGGSIRIHRRELQQRCFRALGIAPEQAQEAFGFLLEAFRFGPPPHGGIAFGIDRLAMLLAGGESLRDVLAFPKTQKGSDLMSGAPTPVSDEQLAELSIQLAPGLVAAAKK